MKQEAAAPIEVVGLLPAGQLKTFYEYGAAQGERR